MMSFSGFLHNEWGDREFHGSGDVLALRQRKMKSSKLIVHVPFASEARLINPFFFSMKKCFYYVKVFCYFRYAKIHIFIL